jgi:RNA recognition motif-containing protein
MRLYIGNLPWRLVEADLLKSFESYGIIEGSVKVIRDRETNRSKGYGFIEVERGDDAIREMNGKEVLGRGLKVSEAVKSKQAREGVGF